MALLENKPCLLRKKNSLNISGNDTTICSTAEEITCLLKNPANTEMWGNDLAFPAPKPYC